MIVILALAFRLFLTRRLVGEAREQAERGRLGSMEGHAEMDMSVGGDGSVWRRLRSPAGFTATSHIYVMEWAAILRDIAIGLVAAGMLAAWVPDSWWRSLFLTHHGTLANVWGPIIGPLVAVLSFVCSVGNVPLAAVLWSGGISFGGVVAFLFADLIVLPIIVAYRKYYGTKFALRITALMFVTTVAAALIVDLLFGGLGLIPTGARPSRGDIFAPVKVDYNLFLNIAGLLVFAALMALTMRRGVTDPVCGMRVDRSKALVKAGHHFCSEHCLRAFETAVTERT
jgi:hypothetical protein